MPLCLQCLDTEHYIFVKFHLIICPHPANNLSFFSLHPKLRDRVPLSITATNISSQRAVKNCVPLSVRSSGKNLNVLQREIELILLIARRSLKYSMSFFLMDMNLNYSLLILSLEHIFPRVSPKSAMA